MFENTLKLVQECDLTFLHVFPYSERDGTPAARIPNKVPVPIRKERAARLRALGEIQLARLLERSVGQEFDVIVEKGQIGRTETFLQVSLPEKHEAGKLIRIQTTGVKGEMLVGVRV